LQIKNEKKHIWFYILTRFKLGVNATDIHRELSAAWGESYVSFPCVTKRIHEFHEGRESIEDATRPGRPVTEATPVNIETVRQLIDNDPSISIRYIAAETRLSYYTVQTIITNHLKLKKLCSRRVSHFLTKEQENSSSDVQKKIWRNSNPEHGECVTW
jgi:hypothetical protein